MSKRFTLNKADMIAWVKNALWFTAPVLLIYFGSVISIFSAQGYVFNIKDFIPNNLTVVAMWLWVLNRIVDALRRFVTGK